jgi:alkaline phosphatase D
MLGRPALALLAEMLTGRGPFNWMLLVCLAMLVACRPLSPGGNDGPHLTHGIAAGEVTATSAVVWGRCDRATALRVQLGDAEHSTDVTTATDFTGKVALTGLSAGQHYTYRVWCGDARAAALAGEVRTAPGAADPRPVHFIWGGDVGGQNACRDRQRGYPIFTDIANRQPDFFIGLGDMIYADDACLPLGRYGNIQIVGPLPAAQLDGFRAFWRYNRADPPTQRVLATVPYYAVWDDHETRNDAGPHDDESIFAPGGHLLPIALQAFLDYQPLIPPPSDPTRLYRTARWGKHVELFVLDLRQYRDPVRALDTTEHPKSMLGAQQFAWLEQALAASDATWKVIVASVPLAIPTHGDSFADGGEGVGYEREAARIFRTLRDDGIRNSLWITTDIHFATGFVYHPFADDPSWTSYEFASGPLNAGVFPHMRVDDTFHPQRLFFYGPASPDAIGSYEEALGWFNFGVVDVDAQGGLTVSIVNGRGETVYRMTLPADGR